MRILVILSFLLFSESSFSAILIEEGGRPVNVSSSYKTAANGLDLRSIRRVGLGVSAAGPNGLFGGNLELNITRRYGVGLGFGFSTEFQSFHTNLRRFLGGEEILPYFSIGYAYWSNNGEKKGGISKTNPGFLAEQFMSDEDKRAGRISEHIIYPAIGLQYLLLSGEWAGLGVTLELDLLLALESLEAAPTGSLGVMYYF